MYRGQSSSGWRIMGRVLMLDRFLRMLIRFAGGRL
jgi:hypothetical protein